MEPATEEEMAFCWRALVDEGKLSIDKLQAFMKDVCGVTLSPTQAKDLVSYMDANGDGRVGLDDFRHFMSIGCLADTDPKSFMWAPSAKYRQEHGLTESHQRQERESIFDSFDDAFLNLELQRGSAVSSGAVHVAEMLAPPGLPPQAGSSSGGASSTATTTVPVPVPPSAPKGAGSARFRKATTRSNVAFSDSGGRSKSSRLLGGHGDKPQPAVPAARPVAVEEPPPLLQQKTRTMSLDATTQARVDAVLQKYEQATWETLLKDEMMYKRQMFERFAGSGKMTLGTTEYHQMIMKWYSHVSDVAPGRQGRTIRPADSLATLHYHARREAELKAGAGGEGGAAGAGQAPHAAPATASRAQSAPPPVDTGAVSARDLELPYEAWLNILAGKHRPVAHLIH